MFNNIFPIPWHFPSSNAWNDPFNIPINDFKIISIEKSNVTVIEISSDFIIHKINNVIIIVPIANIDFNKNNFMMSHNLLQYGEQYEYQFQNL